MKYFTTLLLLVSPLFLLAQMNTDCNCPEVIEPVCVITDNAEIIDFNNACLAECAGHSSNNFVACNANCYTLIIASQINEFKFAFGSITTGGAVQYHWDFGDGQTSTEGTPVHVYAGIGVYIVSLKIITETGCTYTDYHVLYAGPECYNIIIATHPEPLTYAFGAIATGHVELYNWSFGDGYYSQEAAPVHQYESEGVYFVFLTTITQEWCIYTDTLELVIEAPCFCPEDVYDPVCVQLDDGNTVEYENACRACCDGYDIFVPCDSGCPCPDVWDPVCVTTCLGNELTFGNSCEAECAGYDNYYVCSEPCICPEIYDPVCVQLDDGSTVEYDNACLACCDGYDIFVPCASGCPCPDVWDPVCVTTCLGNELTFGNGCEAECAGYNDYISCEVVVNEIAAGFARQKLVYPNPSFGEVNIDIFSFEQPDQILIYHVSGELISTKHILEKEANRTHTFELTKGHYIIAVQNSQGKITAEQIIVMQP